MAGKWHAKDMTGQKFGFLTVIRRDGDYPRPTGTHAKWVCQCRCGREAIVTGNHLRCGKTKSCGCHKGGVTHGHTRNRVVTRDYSTYLAMVKRCVNPNDDAWHLYGGRGITVCDRWRNSFQAYLEDMGPKPEGLTLDRINVNGNYEPGNCRWATWKVQRDNQRPKQIKKHLTSLGNLSVKEMSKVTGLSDQCLYRRLRLGLRGEALIQPKGMKTKLLRSMTF